MSRSIIRPRFSAHPDTPHWRKIAEQLRTGMFGDPGVVNRADDVGAPLADTLEYTGFESRRGLSRVTVFEGLQRLAHLRTAIWHTSALREPYEIINLGEPVMLGLTTPTRTRSPSIWPIPWGIAWTARHPPLLDVLLRVGPAWVADAPGIQHSTCSRQIIEAYPLFETRAPGWVKHLEDLIDILQPFVEDPRKRKWYLRSYTLMRLMHAFERLDTNEINDRLYDAVKQYAGDVDTNGTFVMNEEALAWVQLGLAAKAHDAGVEIEVESDYIPLWMVRGEWPKLPA